MTAPDSLRQGSHTLFGLSEDNIGLISKGMWWETVTPHLKPWIWLSDGSKGWSLEYGSWDIMWRGKEERGIQFWLVESWNERANNIQSLGFLALNSFPPEMFADWRGGKILFFWQSRISNDSQPWVFSLHYCGSFVFVSIISHPVGCKIMGAVTIYWIFVMCHVPYIYD